MCSLINSMRFVTGCLGLLAFGVVLGQTPGFWDPGFVSAKIRSDFAPGSGIGTVANPINYLYPGPGAQGCLFDAGPSFMGCPARNGSQDGHAPGPSSAQIAPYCRGSSVVEGLSWRGCRQFSQPNTVSINSPGSQYWVVHNNVEPAYDQCNSGPPGQSEPVGSSGLFGISSTPGQGSFTLVVRNWAHNFSCTGATMPVPFLSVGAQSNRGNTNPNGTARPVARFRFFNPQPTDIVRLQFDAQITTYSAFGCAPGTSGQCSGGGYWGGIYLIAEWEGVQRMLQVLMADGGVLSHDPGVPGDFANGLWNWPVSQSFFYPGAEVGFVRVDPGIGLDYCGISIPKLRPGFGFTGAGTKISYDLNVRRLFECAYELGTLHWSNDTYNPNQEILVKGIHWFVETYGTTGSISLTVSNPTIGPQ